MPVDFSSIESAVRAVKSNLSGDMTEFGGVDMYEDDDGEQVLVATLMIDPSIYGRFLESLVVKSPIGD